MLLSDNAQGGDQRLASGFCRAGRWRLAVDLSFKCRSEDSLIVTASPTGVFFARQRCGMEGGRALEQARVGA